MEIRNLSEETIMDEACCGEDNPLRKSELTEEDHLRLNAAEMKVKWLKKMMPRGLSAKIAFDGDESVGFIEYMPIELSNFLEGNDLYVINCMVAPHKPPWGNAIREQIPGCGSSMVEAMIEDLKGKCKGIISPQGFGYTFDMRNFFTRFGFEEFDNDGLKMLIRIFGQVELPRQVKYEKRYEYKPVSGKLVVDVFWSSICPILGPWQLLNVIEEAKQFGDRVIVNDICTDDRSVLSKYGIDPFTSYSTIFLNGKPACEHPGPADREEIREVLRKELEENNHTSTRTEI